LLGRRWPQRTGHGEKLTRKQEDAIAALLVFIELLDMAGDLLLASNSRTSPLTSATTKSTRRRC